MVNLMQLDGTAGLSKEERVAAVTDRVWRYANTYRLGSAKPEDSSTIWYVMDEVGSAIEHGDEPNVRMAPFYFGPSQCAFSLVWTVQSIEGGDFLSRDYFPEYAAEVAMHTALLAALFYQPGNADSPYVDQLLEIANGRKQNYTLASARGKFHAIVSHDSETLPDPATTTTSVPLSTVVAGSDPLRVCSDLQLVHDNLTHPRFTLVDNEDEAQVVWSTRHLKDFPSTRRTERTDHQPVPEQRSHVQRSALRNVQAPDWLAETYNMTSEFPELIAQFLRRDLAAHENGDDDDEANHWICKPWNMARPLTLHEPLELYLSGVYWLRISNKEFTMDNFQDFETHFTNSDFAVRIMDNAEFVERTIPHFYNDLMNVLVLDRPDETVHGCTRL
ncbi:hypothetical protein PInf_029369 [Phytophthora infestans]|nr:hypothetical protein PInf_029369 [Phytophthora infestans]